MKSKRSKLRAASLGVFIMTLMVLGISAPASADEITTTVMTTGDPDVLCWTIPPDFGEIDPGSLCANQPRPTPGPSYDPVVGGIDGPRLVVGTFGLEIPCNGADCWGCNVCEPELVVTEDVRTGPVDVEEDPAGLLSGCNDQDCIARIGQPLEAVVGQIDDLIEAPVSSPVATATAQPGFGEADPSELGADS